jgi:tetratricopeptide (TPR) repeat protein/transcriptional regulator with XRE-family HTH domain
MLTTGEVSADFSAARSVVLLVFDIHVRFSPWAVSMSGEDAGVKGFGVWMRQRRIAAGLSQEELAQSSGVSVRAISDLERGRTVRPYPRSMRLLAAALAGLGSLPVAEGAAGHDVPRELPAPVRHFVGRAAELDQLSELAVADEVPALVICAVGGTAGVGKTALAVQWAHEVADRFPDGQLYVNLRGYDPAEPVSAADALAGFLRTLGVTGTEIPDGLEDRARLYRSRLAGRRVLVLLDNARDAEQVRPLLPGDPACAAVVTSRDALAGLVAAHGARRLDLDVLPEADAIALLRSLIGARADDDPNAAVTLAELCARLPLALRIAAELVVARPAAALAELAAELTADRLDLLETGEDWADVRAVFSWSFRQLPEDAAAAFALLGLHPGDDLDVHAAAALTGSTTGQARRVLGRLHRASLLQTARPGRYGMHDLLRAYAREQAAALDAEGWCDRALNRLFDYYLAAAAAAMDILYPAEAHYRPRVPPATAEVPTMAGGADARAWLDTERANLVAVVVYCAAHGWSRHTTDLAGTLFRYLISGSHLSEALTIYGLALQAARRSGDLAAEAEVLNNLGSITMLTGHFHDAADLFQAALARYRPAHDRPGQAQALQNLGTTEIQQHNHQAAVGYYQEAIAAYNDVGDSLGAAHTLTRLAGAETELGWHDQASQHLLLALPVFREANDQGGEALTLNGIGVLNASRGQLPQAVVFFEQALEIYLRIDNPNGVAAQLHNLGDVTLHQGEYQRASGYLRQALARYQQIGQKHGELMTLRRLAEALQGAGQPAAARAALADALRLAAETDNTYQQASAHHELAESHHQAGQDGEARHHWRRALALYTQLGAPEADQVRPRLGAAEANRDASGCEGS